MNPANKGISRPHGQIRQSQVITTFGPGALMDLPNYAAIIGGLELWQGADRQIFEERLISKLQTVLGVPGLKLYAPPVDSGDPQAPKTGIAVWMFPEWFVAQYEILGPGGLRSRPLIHRETLVKNRYIGSDRKKHPVVPIRFIQACLNGHISDIDWYGFVHDYKEECRRQLFVDERGTGGDLSDITIRCECGKSRPLIVAAQNPHSALGFCKGWRPWLGNSSREQCGGGGDIRPALEKVGLGWVDFKVMRRSNATLGHGKVDPKVAADQRGHDLDVSLNIYTKTDIKQKAEVARRLENAVLGKVMPIPKRKAS